MGNLKVSTSPQFSTVFPQGNSRPDEGIINHHHTAIFSKKALLMEVKQHKITQLSKETIGGEPIFDFQNLWEDNYI